MSEEQLIKTPCVFGENGNFLLERELGRGGMGGVYMGRDKMLDRPVAVKVMLREYGSDPEFVEKFKKEAQAAARLIHPNIAQVYSYGFAEGMPYIAMELVAGGSLDKLMENAGSNIDVPRVMKICEQVAQALRCAADQGLVHGDVKPENILLDANGNAKLVDFGLAAMQKDTNEIWGTPYYIAPEKVKKEHVDYRADMYSLGGTIYHALTGVAPFEGVDATAVVRKRFEAPPKKPSEVRPGISPQIDFLVMKMLAISPADRYPSFEALLEDFKKVMTTGLSMTGPIADSRQHPSKTGRLSGSTKRVTLKRPVRPPQADDDEPATPRATGRFKAAKLKTAKVNGFNADLAGAAADAAPEEEEGGVGGKVALVVGGVVLLIGLVVGGLFWYQAADKKAQEAAERAQVQAGVEKSRKSLEATREHALKFADEIDEFAKQAVTDCDGFTTKLRQALSAQYAQSVLDQLKPEPSAELKKAMAEAAVVTGTVNVVIAAAKLADQPQKAPKGKAGKAGKADASGKRTDVPDAVKGVADLWSQAYGCIASALRIRKGVTELVADVDKALAMQGSDITFMRNLEAEANRLHGRYGEIHGSPDVAAISKAKGIISGRGKRVLEQTVKKLYEDAKQAEREAAKAEADRKEKERKEREAKEKSDRIERDIAAAKTAFESALSNGKIRQFDWKGALRFLDAVETSTVEGELAVKAQKEKIHCMEYMQDILVKGMKGYTFTRGAKNPKENLRGAVVKAIDQGKITVLKKGVADEIEISWPKFCSSYPNSLAEVISRFIEKSGSVPGTKKLNSGEYYRAVVGVAYILRHVCAETTTNEAAAASAAAYSEALLLNAVKAIPSRLKQAQEFFPDMKFDEAMKAAEADDV